MRTRSLKERFLHALGFETLAILTVSPLAAWAMQKPLFQMGALAIMLSTVAMLWNMIYNTGFDRVFPPGKVHRGLLLRAMHALLFEGGFILIGLPIAAWMLGISLWQAFLLEVAFFLFFLPYTMAYNWIWDKLRPRWFRSASCEA
ncbi:multidrug/biocide efflux PACE transporter [Candidatus Pantoea deserta]|uniref:Multidrug/biocide efflux PACE transporter n=1 Tax=Candidatus Pantoea deserta TaxID=1869313 RepID=A0A3N4PVV0_9GAMM|nr:multidrug/biocide efflux PACE transporter [Pantoea deserta]RPE03624.1 multidrug/biocide efflux PACE transporter [Pantoea deserta]